MFLQQKNRFSNFLAEKINFQQNEKRKSILKFSKYSSTF